MVLGLLVNWLAAALLAFTIFFYVVVYTMWLKRSTPQNIVIGGAAGALPPVIGWAAATGGDRARADPAVPHHLLLDAAAFLGAVAAVAPTTTRAPACRCCRWSRARRRRGGRSCSIRSCWRRSALRRGCSAMPALLYGATAIVARRADGRVRRAGTRGTRCRGHGTRRRNGCSPIRSSISSSCSPCCWSTQGFGMQLGRLGG